MKKFALLAALVLLTAVSASAAEVSTAPAVTPAAAVTPALEQLPGGTPPLLFKGPHQILQRCYALQGTNCSPSGATMACTDACNDHLSCTCQNIYAPPYYVTVVGHYWDCDDEC